MTAFYRLTQHDGVVLHKNRAKRHRMKDSTHSAATRKQIKGPLIVVAIVTAIDLVQLVACC